MSTTIMVSSGLPFLSLSRDLPIFILYKGWDWDFDREEFLHSFVEHCKDHLLNPFYIAFPNTELKNAGWDKAGVEAMIDYMNKHGIQMSSIPEWTRKYLELEEGCVLGILACSSGDQLSSWTWQSVWLWRVAWRCFYLWWFIRPSCWCSWMGWQTLAQTLCFGKSNPRP